ncbi:MAG: exodeoxyribonuclease III [Alphaproteobacteria bacterium]
MRPPEVRPRSSRGLRVVSWNINSVRLRLGLLARLVRALEPDVLCLQETKVEDDLFPRGEVAALGLPHMVIRGTKAYSGVAILSRRPLKPLDSRAWCGRADGRHAAAALRLGDGSDLEIHNFYVPAGGDVPDPEANAKFAHKLQFLDEMAAWFAGRTGPGPLILTGDLNVAPLETDVWSHRQLLKVVSHTPGEVERLTRLQRSHGFVDAVRHFVPESQRLYSWWSYRARDWAKSDRGRRLDHVWVTGPLVPRLTSAVILKKARGWTMPSDHVPVSVTVALEL